MFSSAVSRTLRRSTNLRITRCLATEAPLPRNTRENQKLSEAEERERYEAFLKEKEKEGPLRPHLGVRVDPNHGLWGFFRKINRDGGEVHEVLEKEPYGHSGRGWVGAELRRKSLKDLHTLWYVILRERNLLATQKAESRRLLVPLDVTPIKERDAICRKTMARIRQILNERRLAYESAYQIQRDESINLARAEAKAIKSGTTALEATTSNSLANAEDVEGGEAEEPPAPLKVIGGRKRRRMHTVLLARANAFKSNDSPRHTTPTAPSSLPQTQSTEDIIVEPISQSSTSP